MRKLWRRALTIVAVAAVVGSVLVIPAIGAGPVIVTRMLHLQLNATDDRFVLDPTGSNDVQSLSAVGCRLESTGDSLVSVTGSGAQANKHPYAGMKDHRIGVGQTGEGNGEPCARINRDLGQSLTLSLTGELAGAAIEYAEIDLGFKFNGIAELEFRVGGPGGTLVGTGLVNCTGGSDCGPDSGAGDNERVVVYVDGDDPPPSGGWVSINVETAFDTIIFRPSDPSNGSISLEGGLNGAPAGPIGIELGEEAGHPVLDTLFRTVEEFDGELGCTSSNNTDSVAGTNISGVFTRLQNTDGSECFVKPYKLEITASGDTIFFAPEDAPGAGPQAAAYEATLTFGPETATNPVTTGKLEYDQFENDAIGFEAMQWCEDDPYVTIPGVGASIEPTLIPDGQTWCIVSETTIIFSGTKTQTTWEAVGVGDPKFR